MAKYWIKGALSRHPKGALHRQLGIRAGTKIPVSLLEQAVDDPCRVLTRIHGACTLEGARKLQRRARLALTLRRVGVRSRRRKKRR